jgi:hypothetical protein
VNEALRLSWRFEFGTPENFAIIDRYTDERFAPQQDSNGFLVRDYGLIVRCRSPFGARETNQYVYVFAGCYGYGTQAAVEYATYTNAL